jgi:excisionase family DNA binding protein
MPTHQQWQPPANRRRSPHQDRITYMTSRPSQLGVRENTASSRQHASRLATDIHSNAISIEEENPPRVRSSPHNDSPATGFQNPLHAPPQDAATGRERRDENHLLTVHEVAELLQVPASWIYGRMRKQSRDRLPGYRLGKYWRFSEGEILAWVKRQRGGEHAA